MPSTKRIKRAAVAAALGALIALQALVGGAIASAHTSGGERIGHNEFFGALVNGKSGTPSAVVIHMVCGGPSSTGHPRSGQTLTVFQPVAILTTDGNTGAHGDEIGAFFNSLPPEPVSPQPVTSGPVYFHRYRTKAIPTSEVLPCSGTGNIYFLPLPMSPGTEQDVAVPVKFVSKAASTATER